MSRGAAALAALAALVPALALARAVTYHPWADGTALEYGRGAVGALAIALVAWLAIRATIPRRPALWVALPWLTAVAALLPSDVVHYQRINHPIARAGELVIEDNFSSGAGIDAARWIVERAGQAEVSVQEGAARLRAPAGSAAFLDLMTPGRPDPGKNEFWLPRGLYLESYTELLDWEASVRLEGAFSVMLQTRQLLVQVTPYGLHLSYPNAQRQVTEHHMELPHIKDGGTHRYQLERTGRLIRLRIDDASGWAQPDAGRFGIVRFGETRPDPLHAGTLTLAHVRYVRRFDGA